MLADACHAFMESLPATCQVCAAWPQRPVCGACIRRFAPLSLRCRACALPLPAGGTLCGACKTRLDATALHQCVAAVDYTYPWDGLIARFKFRSEPGWAAPFARLLLRAPDTAPLLQSCECMVPVPLTAARQAERGYNQAWELVKAVRRLARRQGLSFSGCACAQGLLRLGEMPDQHSLGREERLRNLRGAFAAHPAHIHLITGRHVLLVDDVATTGATLQTAARALLHAGATRVSALVVARTPLDR